DKREDVTGKYRRLVATEAEEAEGTEPRCHVATIGNCRYAVEPLETFTTTAGPQPVTRRTHRRLETIVFRNELGFAALYDGHTVALDYDREELHARTRPVEAAVR